MCLRGLDEVELARHRVDRVEDVIIARGEEVLTVRGVVARTDEVQSDIGVDIAATRGECVGLILANGGVQCLELTVQICGADSVVVDERQLADARAHQRLDRVAAHAAKAEYGHMAVPQGVHRIAAEQHLRA